MEKKNENDLDNVISSETDSNQLENNKKSM